MDTATPTAPQKPRYSAGTDTESTSGVSPNSILANVRVRPDDALKFTMLLADVNFQRWADDNPLPAR